LDILYSPPPHVTGFYTIDGLISNDPSVSISALKQLVLPCLTLALFTLAPLARMTRAMMIEALGSEYVRTARACGLSRIKILRSYAFRNALLPVVTTLGMVFSFSLGANVLVEKVFSWPGIGSFAIEALVASDYAAVQGFVLTMAMLFLVLNLLVDICYSFIDPRVKLDA
jgi:peptide/nickel transport system permease protein